MQLIYSSMKSAKGRTYLFRFKLLSVLFEFIATRLICPACSAPHLQENLRIFFKGRRAYMTLQSRRFSYLFRRILHEKLHLFRFKFLSVLLEFIATRLICPAECFTKKARRRFGGRALSFSYIRFSGFRHLSSSVTNRPSLRISTSSK